MSWEYKQDIYCFKNVGTFLLENRTKILMKNLISAMFLLPVVLTLFHYPLLSHLSLFFYRKISSFTVSLSHSHTHTHTHTLSLSLSLFLHLLFPFFHNLFLNLTKTLSHVFSLFLSLIKSWALMCQMSVLWISGGCWSTRTQGQSGRSV